jgi:hypothetical protein
MSKSFADRIKSAADFVTNIRTLAVFLGSCVVVVAVGYIAVRSGWIQTNPKPVQVSDVKVWRQPDTVPSSQLAGLIGVQYKKYAFDAKGDHFDDSQRFDGYLINYSFKAAGLGSCEIDFSVRDDTTRQFLTPNDHTIAIETVPVVNDEVISHEFFVQKLPNVHPMTVYLTVNLGASGAGGGAQVRLSTTLRSQRDLAFNGTL